MQAPVINIAPTSGGLCPGPPAAAGGLEAAGAGQGFEACLGRALAAQRGAPPAGQERQAAAPGLMVAALKRVLEEAGGWPVKVGLRPLLDNLLATGGLGDTLREHLLDQSTTDEGEIDLAALLEAVSALVAGGPLGPPEHSNAAEALACAGSESGRAGAGSGLPGEMAGLILEPTSSSGAGPESSEQSGGDAAQAARAAGDEAAAQAAEMALAAKGEPKAAGGKSGRPPEQRSDPQVSAAAGGEKQAPQAQGQPGPQVGVPADSEAPRPAAVAAEAAVRTLEAQGPVVALEAVRAAAPQGKERGGGKAEERPEVKPGVGLEAAPQAAAGAPASSEGQPAARPPHVAPLAAAGQARAEAGTTQGGQESVAAPAARAEGEAPVGTENFGGQLEARLNAAPRPGQPVATERPAPAPELVSQVAQQVERAIVGGLRRGEEQLKLRLKPPELGELRLELALRGENLKVVMVAETAAARDSLQAALPELRGSLADQGLRLEQFSVFVRHEGANSFGQQWGRPHQGGTPQAAQFIEQAEGGAAAPAAWADAGRIDVFC